MSWQYLYMSTVHTQMYSLWRRIFTVRHPLGKPRKGIFNNNWNYVDALHTLRTHRTSYLSKSQAVLWTLTMRHMYGILGIITPHWSCALAEQQRDTVHARSHTGRCPTNRGECPSRLATRPPPPLPPPPPRTTDRYIEESRAGGEEERDREQLLHPAPLFHTLPPLPPPCKAENRFQKKGRGRGFKLNWRENQRYSVTRWIFVLKVWTF